MNLLVIEWRHLVGGGRTCERCESTGTNLRAVVAELTPALGVQRIALDAECDRLNDERRGMTSLRDQYHTAEHHHV